MGPTGRLWGYRYTEPKVPMTTLSKAGAVAFSFLLWQEWYRHMYCSLYLTSWSSVRTQRNLREEEQEALGYKLQHLASITVYQPME